MWGKSALQYKVKLVLFRQYYREKNFKAQILKKLLCYPGLLKLTSITILDQVTIYIFGARQNKCGKSLKFLQFLVDNKISISSHYLR